MGEGKLRPSHFCHSWVCDSLLPLSLIHILAGEEGITARQIADLLSLPPTGVVQSLEKLAQKYQEDTDTSLCLMETCLLYTSD